MRNRLRFMPTLASSIVSILLLASVSLAMASDGKTDNSKDWFYPAWAIEGKYNNPIIVRDTDSALGRYSLKTKEVGLKDIARIHGHLCDGMVISFVEIKAALNKLFPNGVVDRTDLKVVSKNGPCWVDTAMMMTGARINFETLRIDASIGNGFIVQRISTGEAYDVHLKPGVFPDDQAALERNIRKTRSEGKPVSAEDIDKDEKMADALSAKLLNSPADDILIIKALSGYKFSHSDMFGNRGDVVNKNMPR